MSLMRFYYDPFSEFDRLFDDAFSSRFARPSGTSLWGGTTEARDVFRPRMDLHENSETNTVTASFDLPGMKREDVNIDVHQDRLTISGESTAAHARDESGYSVRERSWGRFSRTLLLPQGTKPEDVKAKMDHGVLNITFPKAKAAQEPKRITIE